MKSPPSPNSCKCWNEPVILMVIDTIGCTKEIVYTNVDQQAKYLLEVKENRGVPI